MKSKETKQKEALERQSVRESRSPKQQIEELDSRLGKDIGANKERIKLADLIKKVEQEVNHNKKRKE